MPVLQIHNAKLYLGILVALLFLIITALGPGLLKHETALFSWHYQVFEMLCHQLPERSYVVGGNTMAVCSRCFGFYAMLFVGWIVMPLAAYMSKPSEKWEKKLFSAAILLNLTDVIGNYFEVWTNTLNSRFLMGAFLGLSIALFLTHNFYSHKPAEK